MKKNICKKIYLALFCLLATTGRAQNEDIVAPARFTTWAQEMQTIARNNTALRAQHDKVVAAKIAGSADNMLPAPEAEVAYMFGSPDGVPGRTNVSIAQSLDWGVLTGHRRRMSQAANTVAEAAYRMEFQKVMAEADALLVNAVYSNRMCRELEERNRQAQEIRRMYEKKFANGDINIIELNKVRLNASVSEAELSRAQAERGAVMQSLSALNGGMAMAVSDTVYPSSTALPALEVMKQSLPQSAAIQQAEAELAQSQTAIKLAKVEAMPEFSVGFQGEYIKDNNYSGPSIGMTIPLWGGGRRRIKAARAEKAASEQNLAAVKQQQQSSLEMLYQQATDLTATADRLRKDLSATSNDALLRRSLEEGQISLLSYLLELSFYYSARTAQLDAERDAQMAQSRLRAMMY